MAERTFTITQSGYARGFTIIPGGSVRTFTVNNGIGPTGPAGTNGANGGSTSAWKYKAKTNATSGYPTDGHLLWNNATQTSATSIIVSHLTDDDTDIELFLSFFVLNQKIFIQDRDDSSKNQVWRITGTPTVTGANTSTAYYTFPVTLVSSAGSAFTNNHSILFGQIVVATNSVTSATTSDGTATLSTSTLTTGTLTVSTSGVFNATSYTFGTGAASAMRTALGLGTLATQSGTFSGTSSGTNTGDQDLSGYALTSSLGTGAAFDAAPTANSSTEEVVTTAVAQTLTNKTLTTPTIAQINGSTTASGTLTLNSTTNATKGKIIFGTASASAYDQVNDRFAIGTITPGYPMEVVRNTASTADADIPQILLHNLNTSATAFAIMRVKIGTGYTGGYPDIFLQASGGTGGTISIRGVSNHAMRFLTNDTARMTISAAGGLSIGTTTDAGATNLLVAGTAKSNGGFVYGTFTVATFPATTYLEAVVTDALAPIQGATVAAGGSAKCKVMYNGSAKIVTAVL